MICGVMTDHCGEPLEEIELCSEPRMYLLMDYIELDEYEALPEEEKKYFYEELYFEVAIWEGPSDAICRNN